MKKFLYVALGLLTAFAIIQITVRVFTNEAITIVEMISLIIELIVTLSIFVTAEQISIREQKRVKKEYEDRIYLIDSEKNRVTEALNNVNSDIKKSISFVSTFEEYCLACKETILIAENDSEISTIQTPLNLYSDTTPDSGYYKDYITVTAAQLLLKNKYTQCSKILSYRRLVVINDIKDKKEIKDEIEKIIVFVKAIYSQLDQRTEGWKPSLNGIHVGIIKSKDIFNSPFSHLDVLLIKNTHIVIAFPLENKNTYLWGTSLHLHNNKGYFDEFKEHVPKFEQIFQKVWVNPNIKIINFGDYHNIDDLQSSKINIIKAIQDKFLEIVTVSPPRARKRDQSTKNQNSQPPLVKN